jgi:MFS superfamily sulfate permease-like transporter
MLMLLARASRPHVAFLGRIPGTNSYSDLARHPNNETLPGVLAFRPEWLIYVNADAVLEVPEPTRIDGSDIRLVVRSPARHKSRSPSRMLHELHAKLPPAELHCALEHTDGCGSAAADGIGERSRARQNGNLDRL